MPSLPPRGVVAVMSDNETADAVVLRINLTHKPNS
jgi:hypothetical protein